MTIEASLNSKFVSSITSLPTSNNSKVPQFILNFSPLLPHKVRLIIMFVGELNAHLTVYLAVKILTRNEKYFWLISTRIRDEYPNFRDHVCSELKVRSMCLSIDNNRNVF